MKGLDNVRLKLGISLPRDNADPVIYARGGLARAHYASGGSPAMAPALIDTSGSGLAPAAPALPTNSEVDAYVAQAAKARGIDPDVAVRLWHAEGRSGNPAEAWRSKAILKDGQRENSYGPLQLNVKNGVGAQMIKDTGVDPSKVENWKPSVDYGLDHAKRAGWNDWMGAKAIGLAPRQGLPPVGGQGSSGISPASDPNPTSDGGAPVPSGGFVIPGQKPGFSLSGLFAGDGNPNLIEKVMGHQMSPEARNAVMAASFAALAGRSPYMGVNIGEAGKVGMETYYNALKQKADVANTLATAGKTKIETQGDLLDQKNKQLTLYKQFEQNYLLGPHPKDVPYMSISQWAKTYGYPDLFGPESDGSAPSTSGHPAAQNNGPPALTDGTNNGGPMSNDAPAHPLGSPTIVAKPFDGPSPDKEGTLPFYNQMADKYEMILRTSIGDANKEQARQSAQYYRTMANNIQNSDGYKNYEQFNSDYATTRQALEKLATINAKFQGGRLADIKADLLGVAQSLGITLPEGWANDPAAYDEIMKNAMTVAIRNAQQSGGFSTAPASMLDASGHVTPIANMAPAARYNMIKTMLADLEYKHDLFATWDQGQNYAQHQADFRSKYPLDVFMEHANSILPKPALPPNSGDPADPSAAISSGAAVSSDNQKKFDALAPNAEEGTEIHKGNKDGPVIAKKVGGKWVTP